MVYSDKVINYYVNVQKQIEKIGVCLKSRLVFSVFLKIQKSLFLINIKKTTIIIVP